MNITIYNYHIYKDYIELISPGTVTTITDEQTISDIKSWITEAKRWLPHDTSYKDHICSYLEYMLKENY